MAHQAHPSLANLAARKRVSTFKPTSNATWAKIQEKKSLAELNANKVVTGNIDYFKNHPNYNPQEEPTIQSTKSNKSKHKKGDKNGMELDLNAMKQMIEEQKQQELAKENKASSESKDKQKEKKPVPLDSPFSIDFNSPQMIGLTDQMANLFTEDTNVNGDGSAQTQQK